MTKVSIRLKVWLYRVLPASVLGVGLPCMASDDPESILQDYAAGWLTYRDAREKFEVHAREERISATVHALQNDDRFCNDVGLHRFTYQMLLEAYAAEDDAAFELLLDGLHDPDVRSTAVTALSRTLPKNAARAASALCDLLGTDDLGGLKTEVLRVLALQGAAAQVCLPLAEAAFADASNDWPTREQAGLILLKVEGISRAMSKLQSAEDGGRLAALSALTQFAGQTKHSYGLRNREEQELWDVRLEQFALEYLKSPNREVRANTPEFLGVLLSPRMWLGDSLENIHPNPAIVAAFAAAARVETDPELKARELSALDEFRKQAADVAVREYWLKINTRLKEQRSHSP